MKLSIFKVALIVLLFSQSILCKADYKDEILKLTRIDLLPQFQKDEAVKEITSYDRTGGQRRRLFRKVFLSAEVERYAGHCRT